MSKFTSRFSVALCVLLLLLLVPCNATYASDPESILIRNARLINPGGKTEDQTVNILIRQNKLDIVTKDDIPSAEADLVVDARNGVLLGNLNIGKSPSFLILDHDPREDFEILLDTDTHAQFAIHNGKVTRNNLLSVTDIEPEATGEEKPQWFPYTPPPVALPVSYQHNTRWNHWENEWISGTFIPGLLLDRQRWISQDDASKEQVGDLRDEDGGEVRGFRFGVVGSLKFEKPWVYTVFAATNAYDKGFETEELDDVTLLDWRLDIPLEGDTSLALGKQKEPISMERTTGMVFLPWQERTAAADALLPSRNVGVVLSGTGFERRSTWAAGVFNDWFDTNKHINESATQYIGRVTWLPLISKDESNLVHLGFGLRHTDAKEGLHYKSEPEFNKSPTFVDTGFLEADSALTHVLEASWRVGPFWLNGEYIGSDVKAAEYDNPMFSGYHIGASWILTGEMRPYNRRSGILDPVPIAKSVDQGGWGAWEAGLRWSEVDLSDGSVEGGQMDIFSAGLNWFLKPTIHVTMNYRHIFLDRFDTEGESDGIVFRLVVGL